MSVDLLSLFKKIKVDSESANFVYVYYDKSTGLINKISSRKEESNYEILEMDRKESESFLTGEKKTGDYKVSYDVATKTVILKHINEKNSIGSYDKILYQIPKNNKSKSDLIIEQNFNTNSWNICIDDKTLTFIKKHGLSIYDKILLSLTKKDDPNILYRSLYVDLGILVEKAAIIPFKFDTEYSSNLSIYTNKYFDSYAHRIIT